MEDQKDPATIIQAILIFLQLIDPTPSGSAARRKRRLKRQESKRLEDRFKLILKNKERQKRGEIDEAEFNWRLELWDRHHPEIKTDE